MAQKYAKAIAFSDKKSKIIIKKHLQKRPLGKIEAENDFIPPQPQLSSTSVNLDVNSSQRLYQSKSSEDIIEEQHKVIHQAYKLARDRRSKSAVIGIKRPRFLMRSSSKALQSLSVYGSRPGSCPIGINESRRSGSPRFATRKRPKTTNFKRNNKVHPVTETHWDIEEVKCTSFNRQLKDAVRERFEDKNHNITQGYYTRGHRKEDELSKSESFFGKKMVDMTFLETFSSKKRKDEDLFTINCETGSKVAKQLTIGDCIRIGMNGIQATNKQSCSIQIGEDNITNLSEEIITAEKVPLCWEDQLVDPHSKVMKAKAPKAKICQPNLCESHPVIFRKLVKEEDYNEEENVFFRSKSKVATNRSAVKFKSRPKSVTCSQVTDLAENLQKSNSRISELSFDNEPLTSPNIVYDDIVKSKVESVSNRTKSKIADASVTSVAFTFNSMDVEAASRPESGVKADVYTEEQCTFLTGSQYYGSLLPKPPPTAPSTAVHSDLDLQDVIVNTRSGRSIVDKRRTYGKGAANFRPLISRSLSKTTNEPVNDKSYIQIASTIKAPEKNVARITMKPKIQSDAKQNMKPHSNALQVVTNNNSKGIKNRISPVDLIIPEDRRDKSCKEIQSSGTRFAVSIPTGREVDTGSRTDDQSNSDRDFDPGADIYKNDDDDERTLEEEEAMSATSSCANELDDLQNESDIPIEKLMAMYSYPASSDFPDRRSSSDEELLSNLSNQDLTLDKEVIARDLLKNNNDADEAGTSVDELLDTVSETKKLLEENAEESEDDVDYEPERNEEWKKTICIGVSYQAVVPDGLAHYGDTPPYENDDKLLWNPEATNADEVDQYLRDVQLLRLKVESDSISSLPIGSHLHDDEEALQVLLESSYSTEEALRRTKMKLPHATSQVFTLWSEEECRNFENGLRHYGKNFNLIHQHKVKTRSVKELVNFYYLWKKTERHDAFAQKARLEKRKYGLNPGITDYQDRFLDEAETAVSSNCQVPPTHRSASPLVNSLIYGDPKRQQHHSPYHHLKSAEEVIADMLEPFAEKISSSLEKLENDAVVQPSSSNCNGTPHVTAVLTSAVAQ
ncbi:DgyrCDS1051 [Dimorphilus gyrociliatus]|uniref:DgyrCDS1051 n=1 Tax=Dimorphilus gyrociliatus TaxID=2664684 RepID=A0A7I8VB67_9ANNE|nr:DgyrCDS1051 [Dimorphilus gyrociliatus]